MLGVEYGLWSSSFTAMGIYVIALCIQQLPGNETVMGTDKFMHLEKTGCGHLPTRPEMKRLREQDIRKAVRCTVSYLSS
jgi:hypothetical protein